MSSLVEVESQSMGLYDLQIRKLKDMGFHDNEAVNKALHSVGGNIDLATNILVEQTESDEFVTKSNGQPNKKSAAQKRAEEIKETQDKFMAIYKVHKCKEKGNHDRKMCMGWHGRGDRRRNPFEIPYAAFECTNCSETTPCPDGDKCLKAHNTLEKMFHPDLYKISMCQKGSTGQYCDRQHQCAFAHSEEDHRTPSYLTASKPAETISPSKTLTESRALENVQERLIDLIRAEGLDGIISSELPKRYYDKYFEKLDLADEAGEKFRIKDLLCAHPHVSVVMHKGVQPKYVYDVVPRSPSSVTSDKAPLSPPNASSLSPSPPLLAAIPKQQAPGAMSWATRASTSLVQQPSSPEALPLRFSDRPASLSAPPGLDRANSPNATSTMMFQHHENHMTLSDISDNLKSTSTQSLVHDQVSNLEKELYRKTAALDEQSKELSALRNHVRELNERSSLTPMLENQDFVLQRTVSFLKSEVKSRDDELMMLKVSLQRLEASLLTKHSKGSISDLSHEIEYIRTLVSPNLVPSYSSPTRNTSNAFSTQGTYVSEGFGISQGMDASMAPGNNIGMHQSTFADQWGGFADSSDLVGNFDGFQPFRPPNSGPVISGGNGYFFSGTDGADHFQSNGARFSH
jgi:hypothetical protein